MKIVYLYFIFICIFYKNIFWVHESKAPSYFVLLKNVIHSNKEKSKHKTTFFTLDIKAEHNFATD